MAAARINENDSQRIQRALEVYRVSGRTLTDWQKETSSCNEFDYLGIALVPEPRAELHSRIERRLDEMLEAGFVDEVRGLMQMPGLTPEHASMRAVGYRQYWRHLAGDYGAREARDRALAATRQLAKRQLTWLRGDEQLFAVNPLETDAFETISAHLEDELGLPKKLTMALNPCDMLFPARAGLDLWATGATGRSGPTKVLLNKNKQIRRIRRPRNG